MPLVQRHWIGFALVALWGLGAARGDEPRRPSEPPIPEGLKLRPIDPGLIWQAVRPALAEGRQPELVAELIALFADPNPLQPTTGWYHEGRSRFGWNRLAARNDADKDGAISPAELGAPKRPWAWKALDRDGDRKVTPEDLDWSRRSSWVRGDRPALRRFREFDADSDGRISTEEWGRAFTAVSQGKEFISIEDLRKTLTLPPEPRFRFSFRYRWNRARVTLTGDLGSLFEGPKLEGAAPDFALTTQDGRERIRLSQFRGHKPVVLVFGSFT